MDLVAKGDPKIVALLGLKTRSIPQPKPLPVIPTGLHVWYTKKGDPILEWEKVPGVKVYIAQISPDPATEATYAAVAGKGKSRKLRGLVLHAHTYVARVCAVGSDSVHTAWSNPLTFTVQ